MAIIASCHAFLAQHAVGKWFETFRFKNKEDDSYLHTIHRGMVLLRVETGSQRAFYWIYNVQDAILFNEFVGLKMKAEAHEIIITPRCRLFYDIDLPLDGFQKDDLAEHFQYQLNDNHETEVMEELAKRLASVLKEATLVSLEEHGVDLEMDLVGFDWMFTLRNRPLRDHGYKISIHLITNLVLPLHACAAVAAHVKREVLFSNTGLLGLSESSAEMLADAIDETQYRRHGSLSLPFGSKRTAETDGGVVTNWIHRDYAIPGQRYAITAEDRFSLTDVNLEGYHLAGKSDYAGGDASPEFVKAALAHVHNIPDYDSRVWDVNASVLRHSTMFVKRYAPSMCSECQRVHDHDNTLFLVFNSELGIASWRCARMARMRPRVFYREQPETDSVDIDAFVSRHPGPRRSPTVKRDPPPRRRHEQSPTRSCSSSTSSSSSSDDTFDPEDPRNVAPRKRRNAFGRRGVPITNYPVVPTGEEVGPDDDPLPEKPSPPKIGRPRPRIARPEDDEDLILDEGY
jgi:hypothetical protein